jgi:hypothetical protein
LRGLAWLVVLASLAAMGCDDTGTTGPSGFVTEAGTSVNPASGSASTTFTFSALIVTSGAATVTYQWERDTGELGPTQTLNFTGASAQAVSETWTPGGCSTSSRQRWIRVLVVSPNVMAGRRAEFTISPALTCL